MAAATPAGASTYAAQFRLQIRLEDQRAAAAIRIVQANGALRRLTLDMPTVAFSDIKADGAISRKENKLSWDVPARGGELRYRVAVSHQRNGKGFDALRTETWALFRAEDVFPSADALHRSGARSRSELILDLPIGWSGVTPYLPDAAGRLVVTNPRRRFDRPNGWLLLGKIGARRDVIGTTTVRVAAPLNQSVARVPMLALMRWTLPVLAAELPEMPDYLLVVSARDPMWRGGLSAPNSLFVHADRPLISENGTSTLLHELVHVLAPVPAAPEHDWIDEGLAEYLGLLVLLKSDGISRERFNHALETFRRRGAGVRSLRTRSADGAIKARAVAVFFDLDQELQRRTQGRTDVFELTRQMMREPGPIDPKHLRAMAENLAGGGPLTSLAPSRLPGT